MVVLRAYRGWMQRRNRRDTSFEDEEAEGFDLDQTGVLELPSSKQNNEEMIMREPEPENIICEKPK